MNAPLQLPPLPPELITLGDHERLAQQRMSAPAWAYIQGAAADELTLAANVQAWQGLNLWPRVLRPLSASDMPASG